MHGIEYNLIDLISNVSTIFTFAGSAILAAFLAVPGLVRGERFERVRDRVSPAEILVATAPATYVFRHVNNAWEGMPASEPEA